MTENIYAIHHEDIDDIKNCTIHSYVDCLSDNDKVCCITPDMSPYYYGIFEASNNIISSGSYTHRPYEYIRDLMASNKNGNEFTHLSIYYTIDGCVSCNIEFSAEDIPLHLILSTVEALCINSLRSKNIHQFTFDFTRPAYDDTIFTLYDLHTGG